MKPKAIGRKLKMAECFYVVDSLAFLSMKEAAEHALENDIKLINKYKAKTLQRMKTLEVKVDVIPAAKTNCDCGKDHEEPYFEDSSAEEESSGDEAEEETPKPEKKKEEKKKSDK